MSGLVLELQSKAIDSNTPTLELLRMALAVATKLNVDDMKSWIESESNGYVGNDVPHYREVQGEVKYLNPITGWQSVVFPEDDWVLKFTKKRIVNSISELESFVTQGEKLNREFACISYPYDDQVFISNKIDLPVSVESAMFVSTVKLDGIANRVKDIILQWALRLEAEGILGEGMSFSQKEKEKASTITYVVNNIHTMNDSQMQLFSNSSKQTHSSLPNLVGKSVFKIIVQCWKKVF